MCQKGLNRNEWELEGVMIECECVRCEYEYECVGVNEIGWGKKTKNGCVETAKAIDPSVLCVMMKCVNVSIFMDIYALNNLKMFVFCYPSLNKNTIIKKKVVLGPHLENQCPKLICVCRQV